MKKMSKENKKNEKELRVALENEVFVELDEIRDFHGIKNLTEVIRFLIKKEHRKIRFKKKTLER